MEELKTIRIFYSKLLDISKRLKIINKNNKKLNKLIIDEQIDIINKELVKLEYKINSLMNVKKNTINICDMYSVCETGLGTYYINKKQ